MLGKSQAFDRVPFFWTRNYNKSIQYVGYAQEFDEVFVQGDPLSGKPFVAHYIKDNKVLAASGFFASGAIMTYLEALQQNIMPSGSDIKSGKETVETIRKRLNEIPGSRCTREACCHK